MQSQEPGADALVAAYGFNEGSGLTTDDLTGHQLTGNLSGATWTTSGKFGNAIVFDGVNDWVTVNDAPLLDLTTGMTIQAWVYPTALSNWRTVILKERPAGLTYALYANSGAAYPSAHINTGPVDVNTPGAEQLPLNTWTHLAATYNGSSLRLYINGALISTQGVSGNLTVTANPLRIGGNSVWGEYFTGRIDEVRIHSRALTQAEIQALMATPIASQQDFDFIVYNNPVALGLSDSEIYNLGVAPVGGFTGRVTPSISGLPPGATVIFEPPDGPPHPGPFAMTVFTGPSTPPGTYPLVLSGTSGALSSTANLSLIVRSTSGFRLGVEPNALIIAQGQNGVATVQVKKENGYAQAINFQASGLPSGTTASFTPNQLTPPGPTTVEFHVGSLTPPGVYPIVISGTDGSLTRQTTFTLTVQEQNLEGSWRQLSLGDTGAMYYGVIVGDVGNTGTQRVYGSAGDGIMYEYKYNGTSWSYSLMPVGVFADGQMHNMAIGPARNDGVNRLYIAAAGSGRVYEMSWVNGAWQSSTVATLTGSTDIVIGNARNDGVQRMYVTWRNGTTEFTWNGSGWTQLTMSSNEGGWVHGNDLGVGRNDGVNRIYTANQDNGEVYEYTWNGSAWSKLLMGDVGDARNIEVGVGRNDGVARVYVPSAESNVFEFTWNGSAWQFVSMGNAGISDVKVQSIPVKARSDNLVRLYVAAGSGVYEFNWGGAAWQSAHLGDAVAYMYGLAAGDGLNNGTTQVYGSSYDGNVYLFEWVPADPLVPNVVGLTQAAATTELTNVGLTAGTISQASSPTVPSGSVISQNPLAGTQVPPGSAVNLVISTGPSSPYNSWAEANGLVEGVNDGPYLDPENDGIRNALEFSLGGLPLAPSSAVLPVSTLDATDLRLVFQRTDASEAEITLQVQWGVNLGAWTDVPIGASSSNAASGVVVTIVENGSSPDSVTVTIPRSNAVAGRLFARLNATKP